MNTSSMLGCYLAESRGLVQTIIVTMSSRVSRPAMSKKYCSRPPQLLALKIFLHPLLRWSLSLGVKRHDVNVSFGPEYSTHNYLLYFN